MLMRSTLVRMSLGRYSAMSAAAERRGWAGAGSPWRSARAVSAPAAACRAPSGPTSGSRLPGSHVPFHVKCASRVGRSAARTKRMAL